MRSGAAQDDELGVVVDPWLEEVVGVLEIEMDDDVLADAIELVRQWQALESLCTGYEVEGRKAETDH